jgi:hypothetical protein
MSKELSRVVGLLLEVVTLLLWESTGPRPPTRALHGLESASGIPLVTITWRKIWKYPLGVLLRSEGGAHHPSGVVVNPTYQGKVR